MNLATVFRRLVMKHGASGEHNAAWLQQHMSSGFFQAMSRDQQTLFCLASDLSRLQSNRSVILADRPKLLILARVNRPGSLYDTLFHVGAQGISGSRFYHSDAPMPKMAEELEVMLFEFDRRQSSYIDMELNVSIPLKLKKAIRAELHNSFQNFDHSKFDSLLKLIWLNNPRFVQDSTPLESASLIWLLWSSNAAGGLFLDIHDVLLDERPLSRILFGVGNPQEENFLLQVLEVFRRMNVQIIQSCCLYIHNGIHPYFLGSFFVQGENSRQIMPDSEEAERLTKELCATQILDSDSPIYEDLVVKGMLSAEDAALINAFIAFCHTTLSHNQPDRFDLEAVQKAFYDHPEMAQLLIRLFRIRFDHQKGSSATEYTRQLADAKEAVESYNTGHRWLDDIRRTVYRCCILFITHTLKTNFFIAEKQALSFRLDPYYLRLIGNEFITDLPESLPFRITFFFSRFGAGYHIGFSDIARGGWRTVIARSKDDFITTSNTLFREVYVLAHTQHLKNKDIYEGGSKMVIVLDASDLASKSGEEETCRLYKLQYSIANAFLDIFVTTDGKARDRRVVDYYADDEPIELGPDENMHDSMIEAIADLSRKRGYLLGIGIISSKRVGINHKEYGVTSTGVIEFARIAMLEVCGIDITRDSFSLKMTGGTNGDVAGNALRILLNRTPAMQVRLIVAGTAALYDPNGIERDELQRLVLTRNLDSFNPDFLGIGAFIIYRTKQRMEGLKETHCKISRTPDGLLEQWLDIDEFNCEFNSLIFTVKTDLFIPAGGRPKPSTVRTGLSSSTSRVPLAHD